MKIDDKTNELRLIADEVRSANSSPPEEGATEAFNSAIQQNTLKRQESRETDVYDASQLLVIGPNEQLSEEFIESMQEGKVPQMLVFLPRSTGENSSTSQQDRSSPKRSPNGNLTGSPTYTFDRSSTEN